MLYRHEGLALNRGKDEEAGCFSGAVALLLRNELDTDTGIISPGVFVGAVDLAGHDGFHEASGFILGGQGEEVFSGVGGSDRNGEFSVNKSEFADEDRFQRGFVFHNNVSIGRLGLNLLVDFALYRECSGNRIGVRSSVIFHPDDIEGDFFSYPRDAILP